MPRLLILLVIINYDINSLITVQVKFIEMDKKNSELSYPQQTRVGSSLSYLLYLSSGVVQGSVIWPLYFLLFITLRAS